MLNVTNLSGFGGTVGLANPPRLIMSSTSSSFTIGSMGTSVKTVVAVVFYGRNTAGGVSSPSYVRVNGSNCTFLGNVYNSDGTISVGVGIYKLAYVSDDAGANFEVIFPGTNPPSVTRNTIYVVDSPEVATLGISTMDADPTTYTSPQGGVIAAGARWNAGVLPTFGAGDFSGVGFGGVGPGTFSGYYAATNSMKASSILDVNSPSTYRIAWSFTA